MAFQLKTKISLGSLFTSLSILLSFIGVSVNWYQDREIEISIESSKLREISTEAYVKMLEWETLTLHFYDRAEVLIEEVAISFRDKKDNIGARDMYWKGIITLRNELETEIFKRGIKTYHLKLLSQNIDRDSTFVITVAYIDKLNELNLKAYLDQTQKVILAHDISQAEQSAVLGNKLRGINNNYRDKTKEVFEKQMVRLGVYLENIRSIPDKDLIINKLQFTSNSK